MADILIIDDEYPICSLMTDLLENLGHGVSTAGSLSGGMEKVTATPFDVVFLDVGLPDGNGLDSLPLIRQAPSRPEVIIITGLGDPQGAELAIKSGAWDYIQKPLSPKDIILQLARVLEYRDKKSVHRAAVSLKREDIIGRSPQINACLDQVAQCANSDANVLISGETGTGKELLARAIHRNSANAGRDFVVVDCTVLPKHLVESVLFGHSRGAFTSADHSREGLVKAADGGTLFLDEVGELPLPLQKAFLRVLQERRFRPVGSTREIHSNFRLVSATNRNLEKMAAADLFRQDLLFRLSTFSVDLPPLRKRPGDIRELTLHYIQKMCQKHRIELKGFCPEFLEILELHDWPGNIRELVNTIEKAVLADPGNPLLYPTHLPDAIRIKYIQATVKKKQPWRHSQPHPRIKKQRPGPGPKPPVAVPKSLPPLKNVRESAVDLAERRYLEQLMSPPGLTIPDACNISGLSRARLYALLKKHGISRPKKD